MLLKAEGILEWSFTYNFLRRNFNILSEILILIWFQRFLTTFRHSFFCCNSPNGTTLLTILLLQVAHFHSMNCLHALAKNTLPKPYLSSFPHTDLWTHHWNPKPSNVKLGQILKVSMTVPLSFFILLFEKPLLRLHSKIPK